MRLYHYDAAYETFPEFHLSALHKGYVGIDLFFVLSGFILAFRCGDKFKQKFLRKNFAAFLQARFARLYPAYLAITLLY